MYLLHYAPDNASLVVRLALEEVGAPYRAVLVDRAAREQTTAAYRALCPTGLIPVLETTDGPIFETAAILLWLADRHGGLGPGEGDPGRGGFLSWLFFLSNTLHPDLRRLFYSDRYASGDAGVERRLTQERVRRHLDLVEHALAPQPAWCRPETPGAIGCYLAPMMRWLALYPVDDPMKPSLADTPSIRAILHALEERLAARRAAVAEGLGDRPFTAPRHPRPPEGSAT